MTVSVLEMAEALVESLKATNSALKQAAERCDRQSVRLLAENARVAAKHMGEIKQLNQRIGEMTAEPLALSSRDERISQLESEQATLYRKLSLDEIERCRLQTENDQLRTACGLSKDDKIIRVEPNGWMLVESPAGNRCRMQASSHRELELEEQLETKLEGEEARWQKAISELLTDRVGADRPDGVGCESGDPLDVTLTELSQAISLIEDRQAKQPNCQNLEPGPQADQLFAELERWRRLFGADNPEDAVRQDVKGSAARVMDGRLQYIRELRVTVTAMQAKLDERNLQLKMAELKNASSLANNLCPDHRDKQTGKTCLACHIDRLVGAGRSLFNFAEQLRIPQTLVEAELQVKQAAGPLKAMSNALFLVEAELK